MVKIEERGDVMRTETIEKRRKHSVTMTRKSKDSKILGGLKDLSLAERAAQMADLTKQIEQAEKALGKRRTSSVAMTQRKRVALLADEDGLIELKYRLRLERSEYLVQKSITPDYEE
jgi:hypothetical protein